MYPRKSTLVKLVEIYSIVIVTTLTTQGMLRSSSMDLGAKCRYLGIRNSALEFQVKARVKIILLQGRIQGVSESFCNPPLQKILQK